MKSLKSKLLKWSVINDKGMVHPKLKFQLFFLLPFKSFVHLRSTNVDIFWWNQTPFWPSIDINTTDNLKAQKGSKDIVKIVQVTSVVQPYCYEATRILFVCKENLVTLFNDFFSSLSLFKAHSWEYYNACVWCCWHKSWRLTRKRSHHCKKKNIFL